MEFNSTDGGANGGKLLPGRRPKVSKSTWYFAVFCIVAAGVDVAYFWQSSRVEISSPPMAVITSESRRQAANSAPADVWSDVRTTDLSTPKVAADAIFNAKALLRPYPTDALNSFFTIKSAPRFSQYRLCDTLELRIEARDQHNRIKPHGGDYFWVKLFSLSSHSSQPADEIVDHDNGTYTARFVLRWTGRLSAAVTLVASSEHAALLREAREAAPARFAYDGKFRAGNRSEVTPCHITEDMYLGSAESERSRGFCNFSDQSLGYPWFCLKPRSLPCSSLVQHMGSMTRSHKHNTILFQRKQFHRFAVLKQVGIVTTIMVKARGNGEDTMNLCIDGPLPACRPGLPPRPPSRAAGFYHRESWHSLICSARDFAVGEAQSCLRGRSLFFYGDSTLRQWFEYLVRNLGGAMTEKRLNTEVHVGPRYAHDGDHNISLFFRMHGFPVRSRWLRVTDIAYAAHAIDGLPGGPGTVVLLSLWAHFTATTRQFYRERWAPIKAALQRLRGRAPGTLVIVKSANTRQPSGPDVSNWYAMELDQVMREELSTEPSVAIIDAWDMTLSHHTGYHCHPGEAVVAQEIKMLLSFICPGPRDI